MAHLQCRIGHRQGHQSLAGCRCGSAGSSTCRIRVRRMWLRSMACHLRPPAACSCWAWQVTTILSTVTQKLKLHTSSTPDGRMQEDVTASSAAALAAAAAAADAAATGLPPLAMTEARVAAAALATATAAALAAPRQSAAQNTSAFCGASIAIHCRGDSKWVQMANCLVRLEWPNTITCSIVMRSRFAMSCVSWCSTVSCTHQQGSAPGHWRSSAAHPSCSPRKRRQN